MPKGVHLIELKHPGWHYMHKRIRALTVLTQGLRGIEVMYGYVTSPPYPNIKEANPGF